MKLRKLGASGIEAPVVGFGAWAIGGWMWGGTTEGESIKAIHAEIEEVKNASEGRAKSRVIIRNKVYPETLLRIGHAQMRVKETFIGPARASFFKDKVELLLLVFKILSRI